MCSIGRIVLLVTGLTYFSQTVVGSIYQQSPQTVFFITGAGVGAVFCDSGGNRISVFLAADNNTDNMEPFILPPAPTKWKPQKI